MQLAARRRGLRLVLLGAPGVGKGTQAVETRVRYGLPHIATGDMLRAAMADGSPLGQKVRAIVERGDLVPDPVIDEIMEERLARPDARGGFLLDGFPRTLVQAEYLDALLSRRGQKLDRVINIEVPEPEIVDRLSGRRVCGSCGATYHVRFSRPRRDGLCDACGGALRQRADDATEAVAERLQIYHARTVPLIELYRRAGLLLTIDGHGTPAEVSARIDAGLSE
jgi:adenylate kinase